MYLSIRRAACAGLAFFGLTCLAACAIGDDDTTGELQPVPSIQITDFEQLNSTTAVATVTTASAQSAASTAVLTTVTPTTNVAENCGDPVGDTNAASHEFSNGPRLNPGLIGLEAEIGNHDCYERFVLTMQPNPDDSGNYPESGWFVEYVPLEDCTNSDGQMPSVPGTHFLCIDIGVMLVSSPDGGGLPEELRQLDNPEGHLIAGATWVESREGLSRVVVGLNGQHGFLVRTLDDPYRLYIDVGQENPGGG